MSAFAALLPALPVALLTGVLLLWRADAVLRLIRRSDLTARQSSHDRPTLRLGGLGVIAGLWIGALAAGPDGRILGLLLAAALPLLFTGLCEDVGRIRTSRARLGIAALSGVTVMALTGATVSDVGLPGVDALLAFWPVALGFTIFATVGIIHAFNLIDGMNGMAGAVALVAAVGLAAICQRAGLDLMALPLPVICGSVLGFLVLNYPAGRIFLGDAGAYVLGFVLAWLSVFAMAAAPEVSAWAVVLVFFWPIADTLFAMWRRFRKGAPLDRADRMHFHHVVMRLVEIRILGRRARRIANPASTAILLPFMLPPALAGVVFWDDDLMAALCFAGFSALFVAAYAGCVTAARGWRRGPARRRATFGIAVAPAQPGSRAL